MGFGSNFMRFAGNIFKSEEEENADETTLVTEEEMDCFLQALFGEKCKIFLENVASPNWRKLQSLDRQLFCQP